MAMLAFACALALGARAAVPFLGAWSRFDHYFYVGGHKIHSRGFVQGSVLTTPRLSKGPPPPQTLPSRAEELHRTIQNVGTEAQEYHSSETLRNNLVCAPEEVYGALPAALLPTFPCDPVLKKARVGKKFSSPEGGILRLEFGGIKILQKYFLSSSGD